MHDLVPFDRPQDMTPRFVAWYRFLLPRLAKRVHHLITVSEFSKARIHALLKVPLKKISVVPNGVDSRFHRQSKEAIAGARTSLGVPKGPYILCVGSIEPRKNIATMLRAWKMMRQEGWGDWNLVVAGSLGRLQVFRNQPEVFGHEGVTYPGYVSDDVLPALYSGASLFVYPSLYEGFGLPALEAMACGTPTVVNGHPALVETVGDAAEVVDATNPGSLASGLSILLSDDNALKDLHLRGRERAQSFTWQGSANLTRDILRSGAEETRP
jgi:glycosyltransferase involved in cell wall biosynthesis